MYSITNVHVYKFYYMISYVIRYIIHKFRYYNFKILHEDQRCCMLDFFPNITALFPYVSLVKKQTVDCTAFLRCRR